MKVSLILKTQSPTSDGRFWVNLRITENSKATYKATPVKLFLHQWDKKSQRVQKHVDAEELNELLHNKRMEAEKLIRQLQNSGELQNGQQVKQLLLQERKTVLEHDFFSFAETILERYGKVGQYATKNRNSSVVEKIKEYLKASKQLKGEEYVLNFNSINIKFLNKYATFCRDIKQNMESTIQKDVKFISKVIKQAILENHTSQNLTKGFSIKIKPYEKVYLTEEELQLFENVKVNTQKDQKAKDAFIFSARCSGLRASDIIELRVGDIKNWDKEFPEIRKMAKKTSKWITVPLAVEDIEHLKPYISAKNSSDYVFDFFEGRQEYIDDPEEYERDYKCILAYYNRQLEKLGKRAGIEKKITSHVARNTYATLWICDQGDIYALSKILGHSSIKQTEEYAKLLNLTLHRAAQKVRESRKLDRLVAA
jgi:site-specific recombinase XerD